MGKEREVEGSTEREKEEAGKGEQREGCWECEEREGDERRKKVKGERSKDIMRKEREVEGSNDWERGGREGKECESTRTKIPECTMFTQ